MSAIDDAPGSAWRCEVAAGWHVALSAMFGVGAGLTMLVYGFGIFIGPMSRDLGWTPSSVSLAPAFIFGITLLLGAAVGRTCDRIGVRPLMLPSILLFGAVLASFSLLRGSVVSLYVGFCIATTVGIATSTIVYTRVVTTWFDRARGLALGVATTGSGLAALVLPPVLSRVIESAGWRAGWLVCAAVAWTAFIPAWLFLRERVARVGTRPAPAFGLTMGQTVREHRFWLLAVSAVLISTVGGGTVVHLMSMLAATGMARIEASDTAALLGLGIIFGRMGTGALLDRLPGPLVASVLVAGTALGFAILYSGAGAVAVAVLLIGVTIGSEGDVLAYFTSRYFGLRSYSEIYGWLFVLFSSGSATGTISISLLRGESGDYDTVYLVYAVMAGIAALLLSLLGRYPTWPSTEPTVEQAPSGLPGKISEAF